MNKVRKFKIDEWVEYCQFPESEFSNLSDRRVPAVILEVLEQQDIYDYRIYIDDSIGTFRKVKEETLSPKQ